MPHLLRSKEEIAKGNDLLRTTLIPSPLHRVVMTEGVADSPIREKILTAVRLHNHFSKDNDPHGEHDFGKFNVDGEDYFFKIDYFVPGLEEGADQYDATRAFVRVLTIMRADEY